MWEAEGEGAATTWFGRHATRSFQLKVCIRRCNDDAAHAGQPPYEALPEMGRYALQSGTDRWSYTYG